jgi:hypothetical protein
LLEIRPVVLACAAWTGASCSGEARILVCPKERRSDWGKRWRRRSWSFVIWFVIGIAA